MKKLIIFVFILVGIASCQKEVIKPNTGSSISTDRSAQSTNGGTSTVDPNTGLPVTLDDNGNPIVVEDDITDPLRKKDKN